MVFYAALEGEGSYQIAFLLGVLGAVSAMVFCAIGAAYGTARAGIGISSMAVMRPELIIKSIIPVIMVGMIGIYGLVVSLVIMFSLEGTMSYSAGYRCLGAGLSVGLSGLGAGYALGVIGDAGVRGTAQQPKLFVGMILILIFAEVLGLYGLIVGLVMTSSSK
ncbi:V-ATPase proteolipid subunit [Intoshia linei]|uniref:V-type proton ATPase proteolipid subunit n=1 Tax=Intoshia linei TaxID=1819745 RepID=A0A177B587_9BILA|nr:V-ATPase proteolipid subunit [Intoshia linei]